MNLKTGLTAIAFLSLTACGNADGGEYPSDDLDLVVTFQAGGPSDRTARGFAPCLEDELGTSVRVQNIPGGGGVEGITRMLEEDADGYTIAVLPNSVALHPVLVDNVPYEPEDVVPLRIIQQFSSGLVARADTELDGDDLFKGGADEISIGTPGSATVWQYAATNMAEQSQARLRVIPFKGTAETIRDVLGGHLDLAFAALSPELVAQVKEGDLKVVAVSSEERVEDLPDVPALTELGFGDLVSTDVFGFIGVKAGTAEDVTTTLAEALDTCAADSKVLERVGDGVLPATPVDTEEITRRLTELHDAVAAAGD